MPKSADDMLTNAVRATDQEIFAEAFDDEESGEDADRSLETMGEGLEGTDVPEGDTEGAEDADEEGDGAEGEGGEETGEGDGEEGDEPETPTDPEEPAELRGLPEPARRVIVAERRSRQAAETALAERDRAHRDEIAAVNARLDRALAGLEARPRTEASPAPVKPDPVLDPDGYERHVLAQAEQRATVRRVAETFADAHEANGKEFEAAHAELQKLDANEPAQRAIGARIYSAANPGRELMKWHRQNVALKEIGNDPAAYRQRIIDEALSDPATVEKAAAKLRERGQPQQQRQSGNGAPRSITRLPPSLNRARGGSSGNREAVESGDNSDKGIMEYALNS